MCQTIDGETLRNSNILDVVIKITETLECVMEFKAAALILKVSSDSQVIKETEWTLKSIWGIRLAPFN